MRRLLLAGAGVLGGLAAGCGSGPETKRDSAVIQPFRMDTSFADRYFLADESCQSGSGAADVGSPDVWRLSNGQVIKARFPLSANSSQSLSAAGIAKTSYNYHQRTSCAQTSRGLDCSGGAKPVTPPSPLKVCGKRDYPRTSLEGVGLSSLASLGEARQFYDRLDGAASDLPRAHLVVLPILETVTEVRTGGAGDGTRREVMTDNLAYSPSFGGDPVFVVFPKGQRAAQRGLWKGLNLWEIPWGMAHEFGHHVFRVHSQLDETRLLGLAPIHSFDPETGGTRGRSSHDVAVERTAGTSHLLQASAADVVGALNEGFADLFAFYAYGAQPGAVRGVDCFDQSRDVASRTFGNGEAKALSARALAVFDGASASKPASCSAPAWDDIHAVGAVVAHGIDRVWSLSPALADPERRGALLLDWADAVGRKIRAQPSAARSLGGLVEEAMRLAATDGRLSAAQCGAAAEVFPTFVRTWSIGCGG